MSNILGSWRGFGFGLMRTLIAICAIAFLVTPHFAGQAAATHAQLQGISDAPIRDQMQVPVATSHFLPMGVKGLFCAIMLMGVLTGDAGILHALGSTFIQDIILPLRKKPLEPANHVRCLRWSVTGVAVFAFCFSTFFHQTQAIQLYWAATGAIGGGGGAVVIGGLYWKRGTAAAAWTTICVGAALAISGLVLEQIFPAFPHGQYVSLITMLSSIATYVVVSLLTSRQDFNMDRMLHRGKYAVAGEQKEIAPPFWKRFSPAKLIGVDEEFTFWDRVIAFGIFGWVMTTFAISMVGLVWNLIHPWSTATWVRYWFIFGLTIPFIASLFTTVWFTIGGVRDIRVFFKGLRVEKRDVRDDGMVGPGHP
jgi:SSS family solute:Na+ symporter